MSTTPGPKTNETIVVAEDSPPNLKILCHLLKKLGFDTIPCGNGQEALDALSSNTDKNIVAVISDIMMPTMDGLEFLRLVRADEKLKGLPFILVTAISEKEYIVKANTLKVAGYILKPVTFQRVTDKLQELFPNKVFPKLAG